MTAERNPTMVTKRRKDFKVSVRVLDAGIAGGIMQLAADYFKKPENMQAFEKWKAAKEKEVSLQKAF